MGARGTGAAGPPVAPLARQQRAHHRRLGQRSPTPYMAAGRQGWRGPQPGRNSRTCRFLPDLRRHVPCVAGQGGLVTSPVADGRRAGPNPAPTPVRRFLPRDFLPCDFRLPDFARFLPHLCRAISFGIQIAAPIAATLPHSGRAAGAASCSPGSARSVRRRVPPLAPSTVPDPGTWRICASPQHLDGRGSRDCSRQRPAVPFCAVYRTMIRPSLPAFAFTNAGHSVFFRRQWRLRGDVGQRARSEIIPRMLRRVAAAPIRLTASSDHRWVTATNLSFHYRICGRSGAPEPAAAAPASRLRQLPKRRPCSCMNPENIPKSTFGRRYVPSLLRPAYPGRRTGGDASTAKPSGSRASVPSRSGPQRLQLQSPSARRLYSAVSYDASSCKNGPAAASGSRTELKDRFRVQIKQGSD